MTFCEKDDIRYFKKDSFIVNQLKLSSVNEPAYLTCLLLGVLVNYKTDNNIFITWFTFVVVTCWGYFTHYLSHKKSFGIFGEMHMIHHDPDHHDTIIAIISEILIDFFMAGGFILVFFGLLFERTFGFRILNYYIILIWALYYLTYHLINYHLIKPDSHKQHHIDNGQSNYGPEWMDIAFDTKTDGSEFENWNSGAINLFIITVFVLYFKDSKYDFTHMFDNVIDRIF
jgi:hypothetical protein